MVESRAWASSTTPAVETIARWKRLVEREADREKRAALRYFALVFAELIPELVNWQRGLEGWEMQESKYINSFIERGRLRQAQEDTLFALQARLGQPVPEPVRLAIEGTNAIDIVRRWFAASFAATSWDDFQAVIKQG